MIKRRMSYLPPTSPRVEGGWTGLGPRKSSWNDKTAVPFKSSSKLRKHWSSQSDIVFSDHSVLEDRLKQDVYWPAFKMDTPCFHSEPSLETFPLDTPTKPATRDSQSKKPQELEAYISPSRPSLEDENPSRVAIALSANDEEKSREATANDTKETQKQLASSRKLTPPDEPNTNGKLVQQVTQNSDHKQSEGHSSVPRSLTDPVNELSRNGPSAASDIHHRRHYSHASSHASVQTYASQPTPETPRVAISDRGALFPTTEGFQDNFLSPTQPKGSSWDAMQKLRVDIWGLRSQIHELRAELRVKQEAKSDADDRLFRRMNMGMHGLRVTPGPSYALGKGQPSLDDLMQACQDARDAYGPLEDQCNQLEDQLSRQEYSLARLEEQFYSQPHPIENPGQDVPNPSYRIIEVSGPSSTTSHDQGLEDSEYHPLVTAYLSKLGDLDLLQERFDDLVNEKMALEEERESRHRFGMILDPDDEDWLEGAQHQQKELVDKLGSLDKELAELKQKCLDLNLVDEDGEPTSFESRERGSFIDVDGLNSTQELSEYVKYPLLLPYPGQRFENPKPDETSDFTTARINQWLLTILRMSALDVYQLAKTFENGFGRFHNHQRWENLVLSLWFKDSTVQGSGGDRIYTASLTTQAQHSYHEENPEKTPGYTPISLPPLKRIPNNYSTFTEPPLTRNHVALSPSQVTRRSSLPMRPS